MLALRENQALEQDVPYRIDPHGSITKLLGSAHKIALLALLVINITYFAGGITGQMCSYMGLSCIGIAFPSMSALQLLRTRNWADPLDNVFLYITITFVLLYAWSAAGSIPHAIPPFLYTGVAALPPTCLLLAGMYHGVRYLIDG